MKASEKIIDALNQLMAGYIELQSAVRDDLGIPESAEDEDAGEDSENGAELEAAITTELRAIMETILESEEYSSEEFAALLSHVTEALEEIDPDVFASEITTSADDDDEDYEDYDDDEDDDDIDLDEDDEDDDDSEEEEESDEDESEEATEGGDRQGRRGKRRK